MGRRYALKLIYRLNDLEKALTSLSWFAGPDDKNTVTLVLQDNHKVIFPCGSPFARKFNLSRKSQISFPTTLVFEVDEVVTEYIANHFSEVDT